MAKRNSATEGTAFVALATVLWLAAIARAAALDSTERGRLLFAERGCVSCHSPNGVSPGPDVPHLAGQHRTNLAKQLVNFRAAKALGRVGYKISERCHADMRPASGNLSDEEIGALAAYLFALPCANHHARPDPPAPAIAQKCNFCHGTAGRSPFVAYPRLAGQKEGYLADQLRKFRAAAKNFEDAHDRSHRMVLAVAADLTDAEVAAASKYYSSLSCR